MGRPPGTASAAAATTTTTTTVPTGRKRGRPPKNRQFQQQQQQQETSNGNESISAQPPIASSSVSSSSYRSSLCYKPISNRTTNNSANTAITTYDPKHLKQHYPRRFPRIGGYYQMKDVPYPTITAAATGKDNDDNYNEIPCNYYTSQRCGQPERMSMDVPFRTQAEIQSNHIQHYDSVAGEDLPGPSSFVTTMTLTTMTNGVEHSTNSTTRRRSSVEGNGNESGAPSVVPLVAPATSPSNNNNDNCRPVLLHTTQTTYRHNQNNDTSPSSNSSSQSAGSTSRFNGSIANNDDDWFTAYSQLGIHGQRQIMDNPESDGEEEEDDNNINVAITTNSTTTAGRNATTSMDHQHHQQQCEWIQQIRTWYADTIIAHDFPNQLLGGRSTKSRYKKRTGVDTSNSTSDSSMNQVQLPPLPLLPPPYLHQIQTNDNGDCQDDTEMVHPPQLTNNNNIGTKKRKLKQLYHQNDAYMIASGIYQGSEPALAYRLVSHKNNTIKAMLSCLIQWNRGRAMTTVRQNGRMVQSGKLIIDKTMNNHWKQIALRPIPLHGDYRTHADDDVVGSNRNEQLSHHQQQELHKTWKAVRFCAQAIREHMQRRKDDAVVVPKLCVSSILHFLQQVARLPPVSGSRHSSPNDTTTEVDEEDTDHILQEISDSCWKTRILFAKLLDTWGSNDGIDVDTLRKQLDAYEKESDLAFDFSYEMKRQLNDATEWQTRLDATLKEQETEGIDIYATADDDDKNDRNDLAVLQALHQEGSEIGFRSKGLVVLESKIQKAQQLRERITNWKESSSRMMNEKKETIKFIASIVREMNRVKLRFPEVLELLKFHQKAEVWVDRANIAIRSRISLEEIKSLIRAGTNELTPLVDLSEYMEKLESRVTMAEEWVDSFNKAISITSDTPHNDDEQNKRHDVDDNDAAVVVGTMSALEKMDAIRRQLDDKENNCILHELASDGSRIPVEVECMKLLQLELDARGWSSKTKKWIPTIITTTGDVIDNTENEVGGTKRVGKLEELRDHLAKAGTFRDRLNGILSMTDMERSRWILEGEYELNGLVQAADTWLEKHQSFLDIDGRKNDERNSVSLSELRNVVLEGTSIHVNIGTPMTKICRILSQAENWYKTYEPILLCCHITTGIKNDASAVLSNPTENVTKTTPSSKSKKPMTLVKLADLKDAIEAAASDVAVDLDEATELEKMYDKVEEWQNRASLVTCERDNGNGKRTRKGPGRKSSTTSSECSISDLSNLIEEAANFPVDMNFQLSILHQYLDSVKSWRSHVAKDITAITIGFRQLREALRETYNAPSDFEREKWFHPNSGTNDTDTKSKSSSTTNRDIMDFDDDASIFVTPTTEGDWGDAVCSSLPTLLGGAGSKSNVVGMMEGDGDDPKYNVQELIQAFCIRSASSCVVTPERSIAADLKDVIQWCMRSLKTLEKQRDVFDKRFFGAFDRFMLEGRDLAKKGSSNGATAAQNTDGNVSESDSTECDSETDKLLWKLQLEWTSVIIDQLERLGKLAADRKRFTAWCTKAEAFLSDESKRLSFEKLTELVTKSNEFPSACGTIRKIRKLYYDTLKWMTAAKNAIETTTEKISIQDAKVLVDAGEKLGVQCNELRVLRNGLKAARTWLNRVKKLNVVDSGCNNVREVKALLEEHDTLIVSATEEATKLRQYSKNYCLCRRPFEGFMIGCDTCDEWFHGPCIGVTESKADKVNKYVCVRCCLTKLLNISSVTIVDIIRKWTTKKDLKKARRIETQKHQRKVRKEAKDHERLCEEIRLLQNRLVELDNQHGPQGEGLRVGGSSVEDVVAVSKFDGVNNEISIDKDDDGLEVEEEKVFVLLPNLSREEVISRISEARLSIDRCIAKLESLSKIGSERMKTESSENAREELLRKWCIRVRSLVLVPSSLENARKSRPNRNGSLSENMITVVTDADRFGLQGIDDVKTIINCFRCLCWGMRARAMLRKQATVADLKSLLEQASTIDLPDEKALRMLKSLLQRTASWENKVYKAITPCPGETKPFNLELLNELQIAGDDIPICMPCEPRLLTVIEDCGTRHCVCGGPSDGRFMVACEKCDRWYHGHCVKLSSRTSEEDLAGWICPACSGQGPIDIAELNIEKFHDYFELESDEVVETFERDGDDVSIVSDSSSEEAGLWPPYGLLGSPKATEALGEECVLIPDSTEKWIKKSAEKLPSRVKTPSSQTKKVLKPTSTSGVCTGSVASTSHPPTVRVQHTVLGTVVPCSSDTSALSESQAMTVVSVGSSVAALSWNQTNGRGPPPSVIEGNEIANVFVNLSTCHEATVPMDVSDGSTSGCESSPPLGILSNGPSNILPQGSQHLTTSITSTMTTQSGESAPYVARLSENASASDRVSYDFFVTNHRPDPLTQMSDLDPMSSSECKGFENPAAMNERQDSFSSAQDRCHVSEACSQETSLPPEGTVP